MEVGFWVGCSLFPVFSPHATMSDSGLARTGISFRQKISGFMLAADMTDRGRVGLGKCKVAYRAESRCPERLHESVGVRPAVEGQAEAIRGEHAIHFREGWLEPRVVVVVAYLATVAWCVGNKVRRVREDEIDALIGQCRKGLYAVGVEDGIAESCHDGFFQGCS